VQGLGKDGHFWNQHNFCRANNEKRTKSCIGIGAVNQSVKWGGVIAAKS
jgi:hypothetical protein